MLIRKNSRIVMAGDSVTDCGRARPVGEGHTGELGTGYVLFVDALLNSVYPDRKIRVTNMGIGGNTSSDLLERWQQDVLDLSPDWVFIMIGINDIWFQFDCQYHKELHIPFEQYVSNVEKMVESVTDIGTKVILMSPFFMETRNSDPMRSMCCQYVQACREIASKSGELFVDMQAHFDKFLATNHSAELSGDRVHPNTTGHMIITRALLGALEFEW